MESILSPIWALIYKWGGIIWFRSFRSTTTHLESNSNEINISQNSIIQKIYLKFFIKSKTIRWNCHFFFPSALSVVSFLPLAASSFAKGSKRGISALHDKSSVK